MNTSPPSSRFSLYILLASAALSGCTKTDPVTSAAPAPAAIKTPPSRADRIAEAKAAVMQMKKELQGELMSAMKQGPENALKVCGEKAAELAKKISGKGVTVGRTSGKLRNPQNVMLPWHKPIIDGYLKAATPSPNSYRTVDLPDGTLGYAEPLYAKGLCLACHGEKLAGPLQKLISQRYPKDTALGYKDGDFRGIVWAVVQ